MKAIAIALALTGALAPHDFFVSILTVRHVPATKSLDLTWRMTAHDIEHALEGAAPLKLGSANEHPAADSLLNAYLVRHLTLMQGKQLNWTWVGKELDGETLYCYLQVQDVTSPEDLLVRCTLMQELFPEQQNIVHVEGQGVPTLTHTFIHGSGPHTFTWR